MDEYSPQEVADLIITQVDGDRVTVSDKNPEAQGVLGVLGVDCATFCLMVHAECRLRLLQWGCPKMRDTPIKTY